MEDMTFSLFAPYNTQAWLAGDFSDWEPLEMMKGEDGWFTCDYSLTSGTYEYSF
jgi:1,4-alpha-glucan branching enzyme